jgi:hypothetical protein
MVASSILPVALHKGKLYFLFGKLQYIFMGLDLADLIINNSDGLEYI